MDRQVVSTAICVAAGLAITAVAATPRADDDSHADKVAGAFKLVGVCDNSPAGLQCWKPGGGLDAKLTKYAKLHVRVEAAQAANQRVLITRWKAPEPMATTPMAPMDTASGPPILNQVNVDSYGVDHVMTSSCLIAVPKNQSKADVAGVFVVPGPGFSLPLKIGAAAKFGGRRLILTRIRHGEEPNRWFVHVDIEGKRDGMPATFNLKAYDRHRGLIYTTLPIQLKNQKAAPKPYLLRQDTLSTYPAIRTSPNRREWIISVDPKSVGSINIVPIYNEKVTFKSVAMAPSAPFPSPNQGKYPQPPPSGRSPSGRE